MQVGPLGMCQMSVERVAVGCFQIVDDGTGVGNDPAVVVDVGELPLWRLPEISPLLLERVPGQAEIGLELEAERAWVEAEGVAEMVERDKKVSADWGMPRLYARDRAADSSG